MSFLEMSFQGSVLIVLILFVRKIALHKLPKVTFVILWGIAIVRLLVPLKVEFSLSFLSLFEKRKTVDDFVDLTSDNASQGKFTELIETITVESHTIVFEYLYFFIAIYLIGFLLMSSFFLFLYLVQLKRFKNRIAITAPFFSTITENKSLIRKVKLYRTYFTKTPLTYGVLRPKILLPINFDMTDNKNLSYIYQHEYIHIKHMDALKKVILAITVCVHWFNPFVWILYFTANYDIELHCDEAVVKAGADPKEYAKSLVEVLDYSTTISNIFSSFSMKYTAFRVCHIMEVSKYSFLNLNFLLVVIIVMISFFTSYNKKPNHLHYTETMSTPQKFEYMFSKENVNIKQYLGVNLFDFLPLLGFTTKSNPLDDEFQLVYGIDGMLLDGDDSYKVIVPLSADIKENLAMLIRISYLENRGFSDGEDESKLIRDYLLTQPIEKRLSVSYTLNELCFDISNQYSSKIAETYPNWIYDTIYDSSILDDFYPIF